MSLSVAQFLDGDYFVDQYSHVRYLAMCADGFSLSIQASNAHYCIPKSSIVSGEAYTALEIGHPSAPVPEFESYRIDEFNNIFAFVPAQLVEQVVALHGGITTIVIFKTIC